MWVLLAGSTTVAEGKPPNKVPLVEQVGIRLIPVPAGSYTVGGAPVAVEAFRLAATEVTQTQWEAVFRSAGIEPLSKWREDADYAPYGAEEVQLVGPTLPVAGVSWSEIAIFCNLLSRAERLAPVYVHDPDAGTWRVDATAAGYRLPTVVEFQVAATAGGATTRWSGTDDPAQVCAYANVHDASWFRKWPVIEPKSEDGAFLCDDGYPTVAPAGALKPNGWGFHDLTGNVSEAVLDLWTDRDLRAPMLGPFDPDARSEGEPWTVEVGHGWLSHWSGVTEIGTPTGRSVPGRDNRGGFRVARRP